MQRKRLTTSAALAILLCLPFACRAQTAYAYVAAVEEAVGTIYAANSGGGIDHNQGAVGSSVASTPNLSTSTEAVDTYFDPVYGYGFGGPYGYSAGSGFTDAVTVTSSTLPTGAWTIIGLHYTFSFDVGADINNTDGDTNLSYSSYNSFDAGFTEEQTGVSWGPQYEAENGGSQSSATYYIAAHVGDTISFGANIYSSVEANADDGGPSEMDSVDAVSGANASVSFTTDSDDNITLVSLSGVDYGSGGFSDFTPSITKVTPGSFAAGQSAAMLTVTGSNFVDGDVILWNGVAQVTTFVSSTQLTAMIPQNYLARPGFATVSVLQPNGRTSNTIRLNIGQVVSPNPPANGSLRGGQTGHVP